MKYLFIVCFLGLSLALYADSAEDNYTEIRDNASDTNDDHFDARSYKECRDASLLAADFPIIRPKNS